MNARFIAQKLLHMPERHRRGWARGSTGSLPDVRKHQDDDHDAPPSPTPETHHSVASAMGAAPERRQSRKESLRRCVSFDERLHFHPALNQEEYDRHAEVPSMMLSYRERMQVFNELEAYRKEEMVVHPDSHRTALGLHSDLIPPCESLCKDRRSSSFHRQHSSDRKAGRSTDTPPASPLSILRAFASVQHKLTKSLESAFNA